MRNDHRSLVPSLLVAACLSSPVLAGDGAFSDQTLAAGITAAQAPQNLHPFLAGGVVGDFNRDGWQDIYFPAGGGAPDSLYINNGDGTFTDRAAEWGIAESHRGTAAAVGDYDGDGWLDIYVTSLGVPGSGGSGNHRLYRNQGGAGFVNVAAQAGVNISSQVSADGWGAAWGDYDLDGDLDLAVAGWSSNDGNRLYENNGNGTFTDVTAAAGLAALGGISGFAPRFIDLDGDRYPELVWIGDFGTSRYFINDTDGTFTNFTNGSGTSLDGTEMGFTVGDMDSDGDFDLYVTTISTNNLYMNQGGNVFTNQANAAGVANTGWGWGTVAIDFNHDTRLDLVATTQSGRQYAFVNRTPLGGALDFDEVALTIGLDSSVSGRGLANFDYDNDGDQDLVIFPRNGPIKLFRNDLSEPDTHWLRVSLDRGCTTDIAPDGIGSVVEIDAGSQTLISRIDGGSNYLSQSELTAHFGLAGITHIDELRVRWTNGDVTVLSGLEVDQTLVVSPVSNTFCTATANSTGYPARIASNGCAGVASNAFELQTYPVPDQPGLVYYGATETQDPFGNGVRCVDGTLFRLPVEFAAGGVLRHTVDFTNPPAQAGEILAGSTWAFQAWFRDPAGGGASFDLSDGLSVTFAP